MPAPKRPTRRGPGQLPAGRHGLPRSFVVHNQRERILSAIADVTSVAGYAAMSVEDIVVCAGVSRRTFYEQFSSKEDAFLAAYDAVVEQLVARVREVVEAADTTIGRVEGGLRAFLEFVVSEPAFADMCIVEVLAAGNQAIDRRNATMRGFAQIFEEAATDLTPDKRPPPLVPETIVGGIYEVVYTRVLNGHTSDLLDALPDLMYLALLPYLGQERAREQYERLAREGSTRTEAPGG
jgi:AcrR family transcriptional regulator